MSVLLVVIGYLALGLLLLILSYEALALLTNSPTISDLVRAWIRKSPFFAMVAVLIVGALLGHFFAI